MNAQQKFYQDQEPVQKTKEEVTENVQEIIDLISLLSPLEKVQVKKLLKNLDIF